MALTLRSRNFAQLRSSECTLVEEGLKMREADLRGVREATVDYDRIGRDWNFFQHRSIPALGFALCFAVISLIYLICTLFPSQRSDASPDGWIFWLCLAGIPLFWCLVTSRSGYALTSAFSSVVLSGRQAALENFLQALNTKKLESIETRARTRLEFASPADVEGYLLSLQDGGVISTDDYQRLRQSLGLKKRSESIGFAN